ncbi:hypothetical protein GCM10010121_039890 [Streptomyces brasiliensis]|uniref:Uncharacterized protein n=1 Tax=Streptomyces brasiliensis TaxID=1954 RepID=A0A917NS76_9ACTN|nr:hypothetical protein GCM10010121_039890 [Streptomyces brasiliensis]
MIGVHCRGGAVARDGGSRVPDILRAADVPHEEDVMSGKGRGLGVAALVVGLLGAALAVGVFAHMRTAYGALRQHETDVRTG